MRTCAKSRAQACRTHGEIDGEKGSETISPPIPTTERPEGRGNKGLPPHWWRAPVAGKPPAATAFRLPATPIVGSPSLPCWTTKAVAAGAIAPRRLPTGNASAPLTAPGNGCAQNWCFLLVRVRRRFAAGRNGSNQFQKGTGEGRTGLSCLLQRSLQMREMRRQKRNPGDCCGHCLLREVCRNDARRHHRRGFAFRPRRRAAATGEPAPSCASLSCSNSRSSRSRIRRSTAEPMRSSPVAARRRSINSSTLEQPTSLVARSSSMLSAPSGGCVGHDSCRNCLIWRGALESVGCAPGSRRRESQTLSLD